MSNKQRREDTGDRKEANWIGAAEDGLISASLTLILLILVWGSLSIVPGGRSPAAITLVICGSFFCLVSLTLLCRSRFRELRSRHWDGLILPPWARFLSVPIAAVCVAIVTLPLWLNKPGSGREDSIETVTKAIESAPFDGSEQRTRERAELGFRQESLLDRKRKTEGEAPRYAYNDDTGAKDTNGETSGASSSGESANNGGGKSTDSPPKTPMPVAWIPPDKRSETYQVKTQRKGTFGIGSFYPPYALVASLFGIGGSTEYREVTLTTIHQLHEGDAVDPETEAALVKNLSVQSLAQRNAWVAASHRLIDKMANKSPEEKAAAKKIISDIAAKASAKSISASQLQISRIVATLITQPEVTPQTIESAVNGEVENIAEPQLDLLEKTLKKEADWETKYMSSWQTYRSRFNASNP